jgi:CheY-like chemotaxis protein
LLEIHTFDLTNCIEEAMELLSPLASRKGLELALLIEPGVPALIDSDSSRLRQVLVNLMGNAIKFTESGEVVLTVRAEVLGDAQYRLHFAVRDSGIGIPEDKVAQLFQPFNQADTSITRRYGGTGLGLAISKQLCEMLGGSIRVESAPGEGSTFFFTIEATGCAQPATPFAADARCLEGLRMLIVDDNPTNRRILSLYAEDWGMVPEVVVSGQAALERMEAGPAYALAVLDLHMPEMDGLTLAQRMKAGWPDLPIVVLSSTYKLTEARQVDLAAWITKPIRKKRLLGTLLEIFSPSSGTSDKPIIPAGDEPAPDAPPLRILLAEDNVINQKVATRLLARIGYRADVAANGLEVLTSLRRQPYDLILMDVQMPEMDGLEATRQIRQTLQAGEQPHIIAMTANAMKEDRQICLDAGMDDYISKPIDPQALADALQRCAEARSTERQYRKAG